LIVNTSLKQATVGLTTGIDENYKKDILIYPNPATNTLHIKGTNGILKISICDLSGRVILDCQIDNDQIEVSKLKVGFYILKIATGTGVEIRKFEKQ
jgi:hypothetical protein